MCPKTKDEVTIDAIEWVQEGFAKTWGIVRFFLWSVNYGVGKTSLIASSMGIN